MVQQQQQQDVAGNTAATAQQRQQRNIRRAFLSLPTANGFGSIGITAAPTADDWASLQADIEASSLAAPSPFHLSGPFIRRGVAQPQQASINTTASGLIMSNPMQAPGASVQQAPQRPVRLPASVTEVNDHAAPTLRLPGALHWNRKATALPSKITLSVTTDTAPMSGLGLIARWVKEWMGLAEVDTGTEDTRLSAADAILATVVVPTNEPTPSAIPTEADPHFSAFLRR